MTPNKAILAGGCFWGMEELFRALPGVIDTRVGYTGGHLDNPKYEDTHDSKSGHAEAIEVIFDPAKTDFRALMRFFLQAHDPTTANRQGNDRGSQYRSAVFYTDVEQKRIAEEMIAAANASGKWPGKIITEIVPEQTFWEGEKYHQDYLQKHPDGYTCHWVRKDWVV